MKSKTGCVDCSGNPCTRDLSNSLRKADKEGDGFCDAVDTGTSNNMYCPKFNFDGGDCTASKSYVSHSIFCRLLVFSLCGLPTYRYEKYNIYSVTAGRHPKSSRRLRATRMTSVQTAPHSVPRHFV